MPFGKYKDFDACVSANKDKSDPEAYWASIHKKVTGKSPREHSMTTDTNLYADEKVSKTVKGVQIFKSGLHRDSQGREKEWSKNDIDNMVIACPTCNGLKGSTEYEEFKARMEANKWNGLYWYT